MKKAAILFVLAATCLISASSFATRVMKFDNRIAIQARPDSQESYIYWFKEKRSEFVMPVKVEGLPGWATIKLDKNDVPQNIIIKFKDKNGKEETGELSRPDPKNADIYKALEEHIAKFVKDNNVKKIIKKYQK